MTSTAQETKVTITEAEFNAITYNGATIADIEAFDGVEFALRKLFGDYTTKIRMYLIALRFNII